MIFRATQDFTDEPHLDFIDKRLNKIRRKSTKEERKKQWQRDCTFYRVFEEKYFSILRPIFEKFVERINLFLHSKGQTHINVISNTIEFIYAMEYILGLSETDYIDIFEIESINEIGMCRYNSEFINHIINLDVNELIKSVNNELKFAFQSNNINFEYKQLENEIDLVEVAINDKKMILVTLEIKINDKIIPFFLILPTEISKILK